MDEWSELYPAVDVMQELRKMAGWLDANPSKRKTKRGILRFVNGWLAREQDKGRTPTQNQQKNKEAEKASTKNENGWDFSNNDEILRRFLGEDEPNEH